MKARERYKYNRSDWSRVMKQRQERRRRRHSERDVGVVRARCQNVGASHGGVAANFGSLAVQGVPPSPGVSDNFQVSTESWAK